MNVTLKNEKCIFRFRSRIRNQLRDRKILFEKLVDRTWPKVGATSQGRNDNPVYGTFVSGRERERERESVCVCAEKERERKKEQLKMCPSFFDTFQCFQFVKLVSHTGTLSFLKTTTHTLFLSHTPSHT